MSQTFTASFCEDIVPEKLKSAVIYPIHKDETKMLRSSYRFISILPIFSKIFEKLRTLFLSRYNILHKHQYGFQRGKSTDHAIVDLHTNINKVSWKQEKFMFYFSRYCESFWHGQSWYSSWKIKIYILRGLPLNWFKSLRQISMF